MREVDPHTPVIKLGTNLDNFLDRSELVLTEAIVLGYPPIPLASETILIGARAEVNAGLRFVIILALWPLRALEPCPVADSAEALQYWEHDVALGVITNSLIPDHNPSELRFMAVLGVEPIYVVLSERPSVCQTAKWRGGPSRGIHVKFGSIGLRWERQIVRQLSWRR